MRSSKVLRLTRKVSVNLGTAISASSQHLIQIFVSLIRYPTNISRNSQVLMLQNYERKHSNLLVYMYILMTKKRLDIYNLFINVVHSFLDFDDISDNPCNFFLLSSESILVSLSFILFKISSSCSEIFRLSCSCFLYICIYT